MPSDGCKGDTVPLEMGPGYDFHEVGCHLGNVGQNKPGSARTWARFRITGAKRVSHAVPGCVGTGTWGGGPSTAVSGPLCGTLVDVEARLTMRHRYVCFGADRVRLAPDSRLF